MNVLADAGQQKVKRLVLLLRGTSGHCGNTYTACRAKWSRRGTMARLFPVVLAGYAAYSTSGLTVSAVLPRVASLAAYAKVFRGGGE